MEPAPEAITGSGCSVPRWPDGVRRSEAYGEGEPLLACISAGDPISRSQKRMVRVSRCVRKESPSPSVWPGGGGASRGGLGSISAGDRISRSAAGCPPQLLSWGLPAGTKLDPPVYVCACIVHEHAHEHAHARMRMSMRMHACAWHACVRVRVRACVCVRVRARVRVCGCAGVRARTRYALARVCMCMCMYVPIGTELGPPCSSSVNCRPMPRLG